VKMALIDKTIDISKTNLTLAFRGCSPHWTERSTGCMLLRTCVVEGASVSLRWWVHRRRKDSL
jgi:hypothetical protein